MRSSILHPRSSLLVLLALVCGAAGCSRMFWRKHADRDSYNLIREKLFDPRWQVPRIGLTPDPASRLYDPYCPDYEPLPPDDPAAHRYMHHVAWFRSWRGWHKFGRALSIENPHWLAAFGLAPVAEDDESETDGASGSAAGEQGAIQQASHEEAADSTAGAGSSVEPSLEAAPADLAPVPPAPDGDGGEAENHSDNAAGDTRDSTNAGPTAVCLPGSATAQFGIRELTLTQALELSYIHSREYQDQIESVYLTALDLAFERFQFNVRFLGIGGGEPTTSLTQRSVPDGPNDLISNTSIGVSKLFPSGAQLAVELMNTTIWMFAGPDRVATASTLSYSLVQPLLRNAGRKIVLENLTQAERNLLYATREI
ncbi:MAG: hypothetical protein KY476_20295, partial [Planctomycetes bacterium]|nr:hypothetical protein [Planctomycetota bacterium]